MKEIKILVVLIVLTLIIYYGVEPYAHGVMDPPVAKPNYTFKDLKGLGALKGDAKAGASIVQTNCTACHSIKSAGFPAVMDNKSAGAAYGVVPPDLSHAGTLYDANYLFAFINNPAKAQMVSDKFKGNKTFPMPSFSWMKPQKVADVVAYLQSIAPKKMTNKEAFEAACQRCHSLKYADMLKGTMGSHTPENDLKHYLGKNPPDLSQMIRSKGAQYLHEFINDPRKHLPGTAMPRVGLTKKAETKVVAYLSSVGESKAEVRENLGPKVLIYLVIFAIFAWLWKMKIWRDVH